MKIYSGVFLLIILLFAGCDTKDVVTGVAKAEYEKLEKKVIFLTENNEELKNAENTLSSKIDSLVKENKNLEDAKNNLSVKVDNLAKENDDLKQEIEKYKNRLNNFSDRAFK